MVKPIWRNVIYLSVNGHITPVNYIWFKSPYVGTGKGVARQEAHVNFVGEIQIKSSLLNLVLKRNGLLFQRLFWT